MPHRINQIVEHTSADKCNSAVSQTEVGPKTCHLLVSIRVHLSRLTIGLSSFFAVSPPKQKKPQPSRELRAIGPLAGPSTKRHQENGVSFSKALLYRSREARFAV